MYSIDLLDRNLTLGVGQGGVVGTRLGRLLEGNTRGPESELDDGISNRLTDTGYDLPPIRQLFIVNR